MIDWRKMSRGVNGNDVLGTINAAASLIVSAENQNRVPQVSVKVRIFIFFIFFGISVVSDRFIAEFR